jgi:integrase/recombinase XerC
MTATANTSTRLAARAPSDTLAQAHGWSNLSPDELKRDATEAARDRDADRLWSLTRAWLTLHGKRGGNTSQHTLRAYAAAVRRLIGTWAGESLLRPRRDAAREYRAALEAGGEATRPLARASVTQHLAGVRALYEALRWAGAIDADRDPWRGVSPTVCDKRKVHEKRDAFTEAEVRRLLEHAAPVDAVLVLLGARAGLRLAEALALTWAHVHPDRCELEVIGGKGGRDRSVDITPDLAEALAAWRPHAPTDRVLPYRSQSRARQRLRRLQTRAGVAIEPGRAAHSLRHACGVAVFEASGHDLVATQDWLGHADVSTTRAYLGRVTRERRRAVASLLPRLPVRAPAHLEE